MVSFRERIARLRARIGAERPGQAEIRQVRLNLGVDFGTSYTKVCWRDEAREVGGVVDFSQGRSGDWSNALLISKIAVEKNGKLVAGVNEEEWCEAVREDADVVNYPKMRLAKIDLAEYMEDFIFSRSQIASSPQDIEDVCAIFLANVIIKSKTWIRHHLVNELRGRGEPIWSANVGVPVRIMDSPAIDRFESTLRLAWLLSVGRTEPWRAYGEARNACAEARKTMSPMEADLHALPELTAAIESYIQTPGADEGTYVFFDVGSGTLDGTSFRFWRDSGTRKVTCYYAGVRPLGVDAVLSKYGADRDQFREEMFSTKMTQSIRTSLCCTTHEIRNLVANVVLTMRNKDRNAWRDQSHRGPLRGTSWTASNDGLLQLFFGGGGRSSVYYQNAVVDTHAERKLGAQFSIPPFSLADVPAPEYFDLVTVPEAQYHRFAVAYGLSIPRSQEAEILLPKDVPPMDPPARRDPVVAGVYED